MGLLGEARRRQVCVDAWLEGVALLLVDLLPQGFLFLVFSLRILVELIHTVGVQVLGASVTWRGDPARNRVG